MSWKEQLSEEYRAHDALIHFIETEILQQILLDLEKKLKPVKKDKWKYNFVHKQYNYGIEGAKQVVTKWLGKEGDV